MRGRTLLILLAVVLALGAFIWFYERDLPGSEEREAQARRLIPGLEVGDVTAFEVESGGERVRIERVGPPPAAAEDDATEDDAEEAAAGAGEAPAGGEWRIAAPERHAGARADRVAVDGLLSSLAALERGGALEGFDRRALGFDEPRARVTIERREGGPIALAVGADVPASSDMVVNCARAPIRATPANPGGTRPRSQTLPLATVARHWKSPCRDCRDRAC
jgi:hypothetical protein